MTLPHPHHPTHFFSIVGDSVSRYLLLTSFSNSNPYPLNFPTYIRSIYVQNNPKKVRSVLILLKVNHIERTTNLCLSSTLPPCTARTVFYEKKPYSTAVRFKSVSMEILLAFFANYC